MPVGEDPPSAECFSRDLLVGLRRPEAMSDEEAQISTVCNLFGETLECLVACTEAARRLKAVWHRSVDVSLSPDLIYSTRDSV